MIKFVASKDRVQDLIKLPENPASIECFFDEEFPKYSVYLVYIDDITNGVLTFRGVNLRTREPLASHEVTLGDTKNVWPQLPSTLPEDLDHWVGGEDRYAILTLSREYVDDHREDLRLAAPSDPPTWPSDLPHLQVWQETVEDLRKLLERDPIALAAGRDVLTPDVLGPLAAAPAVSLFGAVELTSEVKLAPFKLTDDMTTISYLASSPDKGYRPTLIKIASLEGDNLKFDVIRADTKDDQKEWERAGPFDLKLRAPDNIDQVWTPSPSYAVSSWELGGPDCGALFLTDDFFRANNLAMTAGGPNKWPKGTEGRRGVDAQLKRLAEQIIALRSRIPNGDISAALEKLVQRLDSTSPER